MRNLNARNEVTDSLMVLGRLNSLFRPATMATISSTTSLALRELLSLKFTLVHSHARPISLPSYSLRP